MSATLSTRLRRLLDVLQQCHGVTRTVAARIVAEECGGSWRQVLHVAYGETVNPRRSALTGPVLVGMELRYDAPLRALVAYEAECARYLERLERVA